MNTHRVTAPGGRTITNGQLMLAFAGLFLLNLLLRVFYVRYDFVNGDEGVRALTAVRMLEGARLYADVVTDKPPGASLFYAAVFVLFGRSMKAVHLAAIIWNFATSVIVYLMAARFYNKRTGLWAALIFVYFSTNYFTQDMMAANTELLMALPYSAGFYFFMLATRRDKPATRFDGTVLIPAGVLTGLAALFKQIGVLNLAFFAVYEILVAWSARRRDAEHRASLMASCRRLFVHLGLIAIGFDLVLATFVLWLESMSAFGDFWRNGVVLNMFYIDSEPLGLWVRFMLGRGVGFVFFNAALWSLACWTAWCSIRSVIHDTRTATNRPAILSMDVAIVLWTLVSLIAVIMSGRFYGHYFIPALPGLSLLASRAVEPLAEMVRDPAHRRRSIVVVAALSLFFVIGFLRCHHRTAVLAYETVTGTRTRWSSNWGMTKREAEAEIISQFVRERISPGEPLYIWGYAHDVYWRTGCRPASRYLTPYYIDGRFSDAEATVPASGEDFRRLAASNLLGDLKRTKPRLILDVEGTFRSLPFLELRDFVQENYREEPGIGPESGRPFRVLELKGNEERFGDELERNRKQELKRQRLGR
ncbi:MAG: glycosyltransferase family 39 protein [Blastocatellia bacterium]